MTSRFKGLDLIECLKNYGQKFIALYRKDSESESCSVISDSLWPYGLYSLWNSPGQNTGVGCHALLQGIFLIQGSNPSLLCLLHRQASSLPLVLSEKPNLTLVTSLKTPSPNTITWGVRAAIYEFCGGVEGVDFWPQFTVLTCIYSHIYKYFYMFPQESIISMNSYCCL